MKKINNKKCWYVTYQVKPTQFVRETMGIPTKYYAVRCTEDNWREIAADINSLDGVTYIRLNKCGRIRKDAKIVNYGDKM